MKCWGSDIKSSYRVFNMNYGIYFVLIFSLVRNGDNTVTLPQGRVKGTNNFIDGYRSYLGIPYTSIKNRYEEPGDPPTWNGTFHANRETTCKQFNPLTRVITGSENCLTLNVYSPSKIYSKPLPVIVFVHGGGFFWGSNTNILYDPRYLIRKNVIVVSINYRLGAFGFLCLKNKGAPGNVGLKDQVAALKWIHNNIAAFGGNRELVTLFGESAGGTSITLLILTQVAKGLFKRAIIDSGPPNMPQLFDRYPIETAVTVAGRLGYNTTDTDELLHIFRNSSADDIVTASYVDSTNNALASYILMPCKEDPQMSENAIILENPQVLLESVKYISNISIIMGYNNKEGIMMSSDYDDKGLKNLDNNFTSAIPRTFTFTEEEDKAYFMKAIRRFYFNNGETNYKDLTNYYSDAIIMFPSVLTMKAFLTNPNIVMYNYYFMYDSLRNLNKLRSRLRFFPGANHADELFYLFDPKILRLLPVLPSDLEFIDTMTSLWTSFAKTGIPSKANISWTRSENKLKFLKLDYKTDMIDLPNQKRIDFWQKSQEKYGLRYP